MLQIFILNLALATSWYDQKLDGWYYFQEQTEEKKGEETPSIENAEEILELEKLHLKQLLSLSLLAPTKDNVENYIREQRQWIEKSTQFSDVWGDILLEKPQLGDFLLNPTTNFGILAKRDRDLAKRKEFLKELSKDHFLLFFFRGKDPFSEKAAEVANLFASLNGWRIKATSLDGFGVKTLKDFEVDKGISKVVGVQDAPSFFVVNPFENKVIPVGAGLISVTDLEQNIERQLHE